MKLRSTLQNAVHQLVAEQRAQKARLDLALFNGWWQAQTPSPDLQELEAQLDDSLTSLRHQPLDPSLRKEAEFAKDPRAEV